MFEMKYFNGLLIIEYFLICPIIHHWSIAFHKQVLISENIH